MIKLKTLDYKIYLYMLPMILFLVNILGETVYCESANSHEEDFNTNNIKNLGVDFGLGISITLLIIGATFLGYNDALRNEDFMLKCLTSSLNIFGNVIASLDKDLLEKFQPVVETLINTKK